MRLLAPMRGARSSTQPESYWPQKGKGKNKSGKGFRKGGKSGMGGMPSINIYVSEQGRHAEHNRWQSGPSPPQPGPQEWQPETPPQGYGPPCGSPVLGLATTIGSAGATVTTAATTAMVNVISKAMAPGLKAAFGGASRAPAPQALAVENAPAQMTTPPAAGQPSSLTGRIVALLGRSREAPAPADERAQSPQAALEMLAAQVAELKAMNAKLMQSSATAKPQTPAQPPPPPPLQASAATIGADKSLDARIERILVQALGDDAKRRRLSERVFGPAAAGPTSAPQLPVQSTKEVREPLVEARSSTSPSTSAPARLAADAPPEPPRLPAPPESVSPQQHAAFMRALGCAGRLAKTLPFAEWRKSTSGKYVLAGPVDREEERPRT